MATIYKTGSRGEQVRQIQQALIRVGYKVVADGSYGPKTAEAVKAFQQAAGLKPIDGIVGPITMARLLAVSASVRPEHPQIADGHINTHITFCVGRPLKYIVIHYTAGRNSNVGTAMKTRSVFLNRQASADFVVDDGQVVQITPDVRNYYCWAVGDRKNATGGRYYGLANNKNTINIEVCSTLSQGTPAVPNHTGWSLSEKALDLTRRLVRMLMQKYDIPKENVIRHYDVTGKLCPGVPGWNDGLLYTTEGNPTSVRNNSHEWEKFLAAL